MFTFSLIVRGLFMIDFILWFPIASGNLYKRLVFTSHTSLATFKSLELVSKIKLAEGTLTVVFFKFH